MMSDDRPPKRKQRLPPHGDLRQAAVTIWLLSLIALLVVVLAIVLAKRYL
jgi:hypothetical protein